jgi:hypothetical protein
MKTLNTHWKLIAFGTFAVMMTVWAGGRMEAKTGQDYNTQSARVSPQAREAAINAFGPIGLTRGQTLRIGGVWIPGPHVVLTLTVFDCGGKILMSNTYIPGPANTCSSFDLNADQLPPGEFDNSGRAEVGVRVDWGDGNKVGSFFATAQVFDNLTGKSTLALSFQTEGHAEGVN